MTPEFERDNAFELEIRRDVEAKLNSAKSAFGVPVNAGAVLSMAPNVVRTVLDLAVSLGGPQVSAMVKAGKPEVRQFVSQKSLELLKSIVMDLEDFKAEQAQ